MNGQGRDNENKAALSIGAKDPKEIPRRTFLQGLSAIGMGSIFFSTGLAKEAKAQSVSTYIDSLSTKQLRTMYTEMLKIRL